MVRKQYYQKNREAAIARAKAAYAKNREQVKARVAKWAIENHDRRREIANNSAARHPETARANWHQRRARMRGAAVCEKVDRIVVLERDGWECKLCGEPIDRKAVKPHPLSASIDHIIPLAAGGDHSYGNCQAAHLGCNRRKGAKQLKVCA